MFNVVHAVNVSSGETMDKGLRWTGGHENAVGCGMLGGRTSLTTL